MSPLTYNSTARGDVIADGASTDMGELALGQERRQALITAAVTGELDIPGAAS